MKNSLQNMPPKQKLMIIVTVIVVLIVVWQVAGLFGGNSSVSAPVPPVTAKMNPNTPAPGSMMPNAANMPAGQPSNMQGTLPAQVVVPKEAVVTRDQYLQEQEKTEKKYLKQLNDLEQLKLERQIEETNQAIATAKLATVTAEKSTAELLTKPVPVVSNAAYANQLLRPTRSGESVVEGSAEQPSQDQAPVSVAPEPIIPDVAYTVISVSMQFNKWNAVVGAQGKLFNVSVGDTLPIDGSVVVSISKNGVVLMKDDKRRKISITAAI